LLLSPQDRVRGESSLRSLFKYSRELTIVVELTAGGTAAFYTCTTHMQKFLCLSVGLGDNQTTETTPMQPAKLTILILNTLTTSRAARATSPAASSTIALGAQFSFSGFCWDCNWRLPRSHLPCLSREFRTFRNRSKGLDIFPLDRELPFPRSATYEKMRYAI
jgi:hypothetical protein